MFGRQQIKKLQQYAKREEAPSQTPYKGSNRRAVAMIPGPALRETQAIPLSDQSRYRQLLLSLEANQSSCCLRISSPRNKSRAAVLIFRGRVLGCIYGSRKFGDQLFSEEAYQHILGDITERDNFIDAYILNEEIVLAAGSLFHGEVFNVDLAAKAEDIFEAAYHSVVQSAMPGCIVVNDGNNLPVCIVYIFGGRIVGIFSHVDGWLNNKYETGLKYVLKTRGAKVSASTLAASNTQEVHDITFSLSGLADRSAEQWTGVMRYELTNHLFVNYGKEVVDKMRMGKASNKFVTGTVDPSVRMNKGYAGRSVFKTNP
jgi:hypothetical protein